MQMSAGWPDCFSVPPLKTLIVFPAWCFQASLAVRQKPRLQMTKAPVEKKEKEKKKRDVHGQCFTINSLFFHPLLETFHC